MPQLRETEASFPGVQLQPQLYIKRAFKGGTSLEMKLMKILPLSSNPEQLHIKTETF